MNAAAPSFELLHAIRSVAELEYYAAPHTRSAARVPFVVWRYANADGANADGVEQLAVQIAQIVEDAAVGLGVEWEIRKLDKNWLLAPKRFLHLEDSGKFRTYPEILQHLEDTDPKFGRIANRDLHDIATKIAGSLSKLREKNHDN